MNKLSCNFRRELSVTLGLLLCLSNYARQTSVDVVAITQQKNIGKRTLEGIVVDVSTGETLIGVRERNMSVVASIALG